MIRELKQPRGRRQQKKKQPKFAYFTMKNIIFARFARAFFIFLHFEDVLVLSTTRNFAAVWTTCAYDDNCSILSSNVSSAGSKFNSRIVTTHFSSVMTSNN